MPFEDVYLVSEKLHLISDSEIDDLERWLNAPLPHGYRDYMTTLGVGNYSWMVNVWTPTEIRESQEYSQRSVRECYQHFYEQESQLTFEEAVTGIGIATTFNADSIYYLPSQQRLFVLPSGGRIAYWMECGLINPLDWRMPGGEKVEIGPPSFNYFEPHGEERRCIELGASRSPGLQVLMEELQSRWSSQEMRTSYCDEDSALLFARAIQGVVNMVETSNGEGMWVRIDYDKDCALEIEAVVVKLLGKGFHVFNRHREVKKQARQ